MQVTMTTVKNIESKIIIITKGTKSHIGSQMDILSLEVNVLGVYSLGMYCYIHPLIRFPLGFFFRET